MQPFIGNADHVVDGIYIGGARAIYHIDALRESGVTNILKLYFDDPQWPADFTVCNNALNDGEFIPIERLDRGVSFIESSVSEKKPVLVLCGAGISRSSTFVLAYMLRRGYTLSQAWRLLKDKHQTAGPVLEMWQSLIEHFKLDYSATELIHWT